MPDLWMDVDAALAEVPVNIFPLIDDTDFKAREETVTFDQAGLDLIWHFTTPAGATTAVTVTPTDTAGDYDWLHQDGGMYTIEIPASAGASINNNLEGFGWFTGFATGILPWRGPVIGFRAAGLNDLLVETAFSATRGLAGTALPDAAADAALGLPISDAGGLDLDAMNTNVDTLTGADGATLASAQGPVTFTGVTDEAGLTLVGQGTGPGLSSTGGATGHGIASTGGATSGDGVRAAANGAGNGIDAVGVGGNAGLRTEGGATGPGIHAHGGATGATPGVEFHSHSASGPALALGVDGSGEAAPELVDDIMDEVITGGTHNVPDSLGRRIRDLQEFGTYEGGAVWIDTVNGSAGTTSFESGTYINPVDNIADLNTIAVNVGLVRFQVAPGSVITFPGAQTDEVWEGRDWTLALASRDITGSFIFGASITGVGTATAEYEFEECDIGAVTLDNDGHFEQCALEGTFTVGQVGTFTFHGCFTESAAAITIDFAALGATAIHMFAFDGEINFKNMAAGDTVHITGAGTITTETCTAGTIDHDGFFEYTDAGGNVTEVKSDIQDDASELQSVLSAGILARSNNPNLNALLGVDDVAANHIPNQILRIETLAELAQAQPPAVPTPAECLAGFWMTWRNDSAVTTTERRVVNDAGTVQAKATMSDNGTTFSPGKLITGP